MEESRLETGDRVVYLDEDLVQWGPWEVVRKLNGDVVLDVDGLLEYTVEQSNLRRLAEGDEGFLPSPPQTWGS